MFLSEDDIQELQCSEEYAEYIMNNYDPGERVICNGDTLLEAQENLYLFSEFLMWRAAQPSPVT